MTQKELYHANKHQTSHTGNVGSGNVGVGSSAPPPAPEPPAPEPPAAGPVVSDDRDEADYGSNPH